MPLESKGLGLGLGLGPHDMCRGHRGACKAWRNPHAMQATLRAGQGQAADAGLYPSPMTKAASEWQAKADILKSITE